MNVRTITGFLDPGWPIQPDRIKALADCMVELQKSLSDIGYSVQNLRLATPPPSEMNNPVPPSKRVEMGQRLEAECFVHGIDYANIGPALPNEPEGFSMIPEVLEATENVFASGLFAYQEGGVMLPAARSCADVIHRTSTLSPDGFANMRFAALANVPPGAPFFPAAYHQGGHPALALATEAAELAVDSLHEVTSLVTARRRLVSMIEAHTSALVRAAQPVTTRHDVRFLGIDFSMAPYPELARSLGTAMEALGVPAVGLAGSTAAAAFLADALDQAQFQRTGFCGLFFPVLEDSTLASRAAEGLVSLSDLLLFSTVCGTGLDTVPLPGDTPVEVLTAVLVDIGVLALRHNKPLTARLMPIPGKAAGEEVSFEFPYFADCRVLDIEGKPLSGLLAGDGSLDISPRPA